MILNLVLYNRSAHDCAEQLMNLINHVLFNTSGCMII